MSSFSEKHEYLVNLFKLVSKLLMVNQQMLDISELENNISGKQYCPSQQA